ncbi:hypothetical protein TWF696_005847 [Orbilia brochopaga]|uniref:Uncharacterized protein n=1 Tax=Orbilia brochopaga TaxID=3140254 RepID=A0AAV9UVS1_9PEZI
MSSLELQSNGSPITQTANTNPPGSSRIIPQRCNVLDNGMRLTQDLFIHLRITPKCPTSGNRHLSGRLIQSNASPGRKAHTSHIAYTPQISPTQTPPTASYRVSVRTRQLTQPTAVFQVEQYGRPDKTLGQIIDGARYLIKGGTSILGNAQAIKMYATAVRMTLSVELQRHWMRPQHAIGDPYLWRKYP